MTQSHQLQGLRKTPAQGRLYPQAPLGQMYGSSGFCIFISYSCVSVSLLIFNTNNTLLILFILLFIHCSFWRLGSPWRRVRNVRNPVSRTKLLLAAAPFSTLSLLSMQVKQSLHWSLKFWWFYYSIFMRKGFPLSVAPLMTAAAYWGIPAVAAPLVPCEPPPPPVPALPPQPPLPPPQPPAEPAPPKMPPTDKTKKVKKDKVSGGPDSLLKFNTACFKFFWPLCHLVEEGKN